MEVAIPEAPTALADDAQDLTPRQLEILSLLTAGKANKEIAYELGIGLGTVKQHVVALFRKLNVTNRAMAVSRGLERVATLGTAVSPTTVRGPGDSVELRPVTVLSLGCYGRDDGDADGAAWQLLQTAAVTAIRTVDSVLIGRPGLGVDVVFGLHRVHERDADQAVAVAREVFQHFSAARTDQAQMRAAVVSGYLLASIGRRGGWTGETVAGRLIAHARTIRNEAPADCLRIDAGAQRMLAFARRAEQPRYPAPSGRPEVRALAAADPAPLRPRAGRPPSFIGRRGERAALEAHVAALTGGQGAVVWLEGETGMGKTTLARTVAAHTGTAAGWQECRCGSPERSPPLVLARLLRCPPTVADLIPALTRRLRRWPVVMVVDDIQAADADETALLLALATLTGSAPLLLLAVGRRMESPELDAIPWHRLKLGRMAAAEIRALIQDVAESHLSPTALADTVALAAGVPLFAHELAWEARFGAKLDATGEPTQLPLPLVCLVLSRLDALALDHAVLKAVAWHEPATAAALAQSIGESVPTVAAALELAVAAGVVAGEPHGDGDRRFRINHPLVSAVLRLVMPGVPGWSGRQRG